MIADVLRSFAGERADDLPALAPLVAFEINDSPSLLGTGYTPIYADRGQHPHRPLNPSAAPDPAGSGEAAAHLMGRVTAEVRALLQERQDRRKADHDASRRDLHFAAGDEVLLDTEHPALPWLSLPWMGPFRVSAHTAPNTYRLDIPPTWGVLPEFNVQTRPPRRRLECRPTTAIECPGRRARVRGAGAAQVQDALCLAARTGALDRLGRAGDTREPLDNLTNCEDAIAAFQQATGRSLPARRGHRRPAPPSIPPTGFAVKEAPLCAALLVARRWQRSTTVLRRCCAGSAAPSPASVRAAPYRTRWPTPSSSSALRHGGQSTRRRLLRPRWVILSLAPAAGVARALRPCPSRP